VGAIVWVLVWVSGCVCEWVFGRVRGCEHLYNRGWPIVNLNVARVQ